MHGGARAQGSARQTPRVTQRIQIAAAPIQHRGRVTIGTGCSRKRTTREKRHRRVAAAQLLHRASYARGVLRADGGAQRAVLACVACNVVPFDEVEYERRRRSRECIHPASQIHAEIALDHIRIEFQARVDLAAVAARRTISRIFGLKHDNLRTPLREVQGRRQSGNPSTDDDDVAADVAIERRCGYGGLRSDSV